MEIPIKEITQIIGKSETAIRLLVHRSRKNIRIFLCKNCSLYNKDNPCHCENLINFSLTQGWIKKTGRNDSDNLLSNVNESTSYLVEKEINDIKKNSKLYKTLPQNNIPDKLNKKLHSFINSQDFLIFSDKKVK